MPPGGGRPALTWPLIGPAVMLLVLAAALPSWGQDSGSPDGRDWSSARALELAGRAVQQRAEGRAGVGLSSYRAAAEGHVYFFLEHRTEGDRTLVKADQIALEIFWAAPDLTRQRIVGMRDESRLPNRMHYHLDHFMVVQDEFGDVIRLGDGDEVRDVPHPASRAGLETYEFQLADSMTLRLPGVPEPVRVYRLNVRPRDAGASALVGALYVDRGTGQIARMDFTFTAAAYVDRRLESITVSLENGLWEGRYWLPYQQRLEIRRQLPELDLPAVTVIEGGFRVGGYHINEPLPETFFAGPPLVAAAPLAALAEFPFESGLYEPLQRRDPVRQLDLAALRREAIRQGAGTALGTLPRLRLFLPSASQVLRYNRAEGLFVGAGASYWTTAGTELHGAAGVALAPDRPRLRIGVRTPADGETVAWELSARLHELRDLGPWPGLPGALNTLAFAFAGHDELDPYRATGVGASVRLRLRPGWEASVSGALESHRSERLAATGSLFGDRSSVRPVLPVDEGEYGVLQMGLRGAGAPEAAIGWRAELSAEAGRGPAGEYVRPWAGVATSVRSVDRSRELEIRADGGFVAGRPPVQRLFLIGGAAGLPGYDFRAFGGTRAARVAVEGSADLVAPWLRLRGLAAAGWAAGEPAALPNGWSIDGSGGVRPSVGVGVSLGFDVLRADVVRGLRDGRWQALVSVNPQLRGLL